jgi:hypothetical protein
MTASASELSIIKLHSLGWSRKLMGTDPIPDGVMIKLFWMLSGGLSREQREVTKSDKEEVGKMKNYFLKTTLFMVSSCFRMTFSN